MDIDRDGGDADGADDAARALEHRGRHAAYQFVHLPGIDGVAAAPSARQVLPERRRRGDGVVRVTLQSRRAITPDKASSSRADKMALPRPVQWSGDRLPTCEFSRIERLALSSLAT